MADEVQAGDIVQTPFGDLEVISVYPEGDAIADGVLVNIDIHSLSLPGQPWTTVNIATRNLWDDVQQDAVSEVDDSEVDGLIRGEEHRPEHEVMAIHRRLVRIVKAARDLAEGDEPKGWHYGSEFNERVVWIMGNGTPFRFTMMYPEDY